MATQRSDVDQQIADLLRTAKTSLRMTATSMTRMDGTTQRLEVVESSIPLLFPEGSQVRQDTTLCQAVRDGELPPVMPDLKAFPAAMALPAARLPRIRSFVTVPVRLSDGTLYGTFRAAGLTSDPELTERDRALMEVLASAAATLLRPECTALLQRLPLARVVLELSEHDQVEDYAALEAVLQPLRAAGLRLAVDDVGAGFSSLRHIVQTSPDVLELDRSIVDGVSTDPVLRTLVRALVEFAHGCGATVVAEGIETAEDAVCLLELEVDLGQGWFYGRPGPASTLDGGAEPEPEPVPVVVPQPRTSPEQASRPARWAPWSASRGRRRAGTASGSYPGV